ncbi:MAG TPA: YkvA family protein [Chitinophagales bacterium]|nr:YkvA family protein [Chitinophagales bacterium]HNL84471.1 YkvA family protein [Chitinophagales bacterium]
MKNEKQISFLSGLIHRYFPETEIRVAALLADSKVLEFFSKRIYAKIDSSVQFYADNAERLTYLIEIIGAWQQKEYTDIHVSKLFVGGFVLVYTASPIDIIPDFIPFIGRLDDKLFLNKLMNIFDDEIEKYKEFKFRQEK